MLLRCMHSVVKKNKSKRRWKIDNKNLMIKIFMEYLTEIKLIKFFINSR